MSVYCPECELKAIMAKITPESIEENISKMAYVEGITCPEELYRQRLRICKDCSSFEAGMLCKECGSYSAYRARLLKARCPFPGQNKWPDMSAFLGKKNEN